MFMNSDLAYSLWTHFNTAYLLNSFDRNTKMVIISMYDL